jgi:hypothetical protein
MKNLLNWFKFLLPQKKFNPSIIEDYKLIFEHTEYKKHRLSGYTEWKVERSVLKSNKEYKYGYFEIQTDGDAILASDRIFGLNISLNSNGWFFFSTLEPDMKKVGKHHTKNKSVKYGLLWTPNRIIVFINDTMLYDTSDIDIVKYYIEPMKIITSKECDYIKIYQKK